MSTTGEALLSAYGVRGSAAFDSSSNTVTIESAFELSTSAKVERGVFDADRSDTLGKFYQVNSRVVAIVDETLFEALSDNIRNYFKAFGKAVELIVCPSAESDKTFDTALRLLRELGMDGSAVRRDEAVLVVGGGVVADVAGLACALLHRRTPYVMVGTSLVAAIDAGPSPRTCVNGDAFKNSAGVFHPPLLALADPDLLVTLPRRHLRHGMAEIVKVALVDDLDLVELIERRGEELIERGFAPLSAGDIDPETVLAKALFAYLRHEGPNYFEVHQARPHAFGHTWSPGFERPLKLMHGHAVSIDMVITSALATDNGLISEADFERILRLLRGLGLSIMHPDLRDLKLLESAQDAIAIKRGGSSLMIPAPASGLGSVSYISQASRAQLDKAMSRIDNFLEGTPGIGREAFLVES